MDSNVMRISEPTQQVWHKFTDVIPPDNESEIFIRRLDTSEQFLTPSNEIWFDISTKTMCEWEWSNANELRKIKG